MDPIGERLVEDNQEKITTAWHKEVKHLLMKIIDITKRVWKDARAMQARSR